MVEETIKSLTEKPIKSTTYERVILLKKADESCSDLPQQLKYGEGYCYFLKNCSLPIKDTDLLLGRVSEKLLNVEEEQIFQKYKNVNLARPNWITDGGHRSFWWDDLVKYGLTGLRQRAIEELDRRSTDKNTGEDRLNFLKGIILVYDAFIIYLKRYADAAEQAGLKEAADVCREITRHEPQTFRQALQLLLIVQIVYCSYVACNPTLTCGRADYLLEELYEKDKSEGKITADDARLLILDYYCKHNLILGRGEHQMSTRSEESYTGWERNLAYDAPQYLLLCGRRRDGSYLDGELTHLFVEMIQPRFKNPVIEIRYAPDMQTKCPILWKKIVDKTRQSASLFIYNEEDCISAYINAGVDPEDAFDFQHFGCNNPTIAGMDIINEYGPVFPLGIFLDILKKWVADNYEPQTTEELYTAIIAEVKSLTYKIVDRLELAWKNYITPSGTHLKMTDCFYRYTVSAASSFRNCGSKYVFSQVHIKSFASFVDVFTAVDELVIKQKKMTLSRMMRAVDANFDGYAVEYALCKNAPKFGSDNPIPNGHAKKLMTQFIDDVYEYANQKLPKKEDIPVSKDLPVVPRPLIRISQESDNFHLIGYSMGATPDGRLAGFPISQNSAPAIGACTAGLTARLCSLASIPFNRIIAGAHNLSIQPTAFSGEEGLNKLSTILGGYFDMGGLQLQITAIDPKLLIEAQKNPDQHRDLMVRITGYSAVFVDMEKHAQDDFIRRQVMEY